MTTDELVTKYRVYMMGLMAESWATRRLAPSDLGPIVDRQVMMCETLIRQLVEDVVKHQPKPLPVNGVKK